MLDQDVSRTTHPAPAHKRSARVISPYVIKRIFSKKRRRIGRIVFERLTEPIHLNILSIFVAILGSFRAKVDFDLIVRQQFAFSILTAADHAAKLGLKKLTLIEFGVANGAGLMNMSAVATSVTKQTGVEFDIFGFDTGTGLPPPVDYRDHPEYFRTNDFPMDLQRLQQHLPMGIHLVVGDIEQTVVEFISSLTASAPLAFVSMDVVYYSSSRAALRVLTGRPEVYMPTVLLYLADIIFDTVNPWCGELLSINEFNEANKMRKISPMPFLRSRRLFKNARWIEQIYTVNVFDHPARSPSKRAERIISPNEYIS